VTYLCSHFASGFQTESINLDFTLCNDIIMKVCELVLMLCVDGELCFLITSGTDSASSSNISVDTFRHFHEEYLFTSASWKFYYVLFSILPLYWKNKRFMQSPCSVCLCIPLINLNAWINLYGTWRVYHGISTHLNGVLHKSVPAVRVSMCIRISFIENGSVKIPLSLLGNSSVEMLPRQRIHMQQ
jgi:hypothetical protein